MIKSGTRCFVVNGDGKLFPENIDKVVKVIRHYGPIPYPIGGVIRDGHEVMSEGSPLKTHRGWFMQCLISTVNLRPIRGLDENADEEQKDKELTV